MASIYLSTAQNGIVLIIILIKQLSTESSSESRKLYSSKHVPFFQLCVVMLNTILNGQPKFQ